MPLPTAPDALMTVDEFERYGGEEGCLVELGGGKVLPGFRISLADLFTV